MGPPNPREGLLMLRTLQRTLPVQGGGWTVPREGRGRSDREARREKARHGVKRRFHLMTAA